ncbi:MAG: hypothetical protein MJ188_10270 [Treponema sp.]|nr:hypothetical protein [Treponema sp.]
MKKFNWVPLVLVFLMVLTVAGAIIFRNWFLTFLSMELVIFHLLPPFAVILSMIAYKSKARFWFEQADWEKNLYKKLKVKNWKNKLPTYDSSMFKIKSGSKEEVIKLMIQSENVHLLLVFLSYVPILWGKYFGHWGIMVLMAFIFSIVHIPFVIVQRYNLPRIINAKLPGDK